MTEVIKSSPNLSKLTGVYIPFTPGYHRPMKILLGLTLILCGTNSRIFAAETQKIPVPKPFIQCQSDAECEMTVELCGCCEFIAMNAKFVKKYAALERYCKEARPPCSCADPGRRAVCVKKTCRLVSKK